MINKVLAGDIFDVEEYVNEHESSTETLDPYPNGSSKNSSSAKTSTSTKKTQ